MGAELGAWGALHAVHLNYTVSTRGVAPNSRATEVSREVCECIPLIIFVRNNFPCTGCASRWRGRCRLLQWRACFLLGQKVLLCRGIAEHVSWVAGCRGWSPGLGVLLWSRTGCGGHRGMEGW